jgi:hypothetical protein
VRESAFDDPAFRSEVRSVLDAAPCDDRFDASRAQETTVLVVVVAAISEHGVGLLAWPAALAGNWAGVEIVEQW